MRYAVTEVSEGTERVWGLLPESGPDDLADVNNLVSEANLRDVVGTELGYPCLVGELRLLGLSGLPFKNFIQVTVPTKPNYLVYMYVSICILYVCIYVSAVW